MSRTTLRAMLQKPFGPFDDTEVLSGTLKSTKRTVIGLKQVGLSCEGRLTGLTYCEPCQPEYNLLPNHQVHIHGIVEVKNLSWLSAEGQERIQRAMRQRDGPASQITLARLYEGSSFRQSGLTVKIRINAIKNMSALYLTANDIPNGLFLKTEHNARYYEVESMDDATYSRSKLYLSRYRTLRVLKDIVKFDEENSSEPTQLKERSPQWFAALYLKFMRNSFLEGTSAVHMSSDSESDVEDGHSHPVRPDLQHAIRHTSKREVLPLLETHARWLIQDQEKVLRKNSRCFDVHVWGHWMRKGFQDIRSGRGYGGSSDHSEEDEEDQMDVDGEIDEQLSSPLTPPLISRKQRGKRKATSVPASTIAPVAGSSRAHSRTSPSPSPPPQYTLSQLPETEMRTYDSDFSPASTPDWSGDSDAESRRPPLPLDSVDSRIPAILYFSPTLPDFSFKWICPVDDCDYIIDLLDLSEDNCRGIPEDCLERLQRTDWRLHEDWIKECFEQMVSIHYEDHFRDLGLGSAMDDGKDRQVNVLDGSGSPQRIKEELD